jgi:hypothetical protein
VVLECNFDRVLLIRNKKIRTREAKTQSCDDPSRWYRLTILGRWVDAGIRYVIPSNEWSGTTTFQPGGVDDGDE